MLATTSTLSFAEDAVQPPAAQTSAAPTSPPADTFSAALPAIPEQTAPVEPPKEEVSILDAKRERPDDTVEDQEEMSRLKAEQAEAARQKKAKEDLACEIAGLITRVEQVSRSPWTDGTPSTMMTTETQIWVMIGTRTPHRKDIPADKTPCKKNAEKETRVYKLCSPTFVKRGQLIQGTEATDTGTNGQVVGCLFDIIPIK